MLGNGNVYSRNGLTLTGSLGKTIGDAHWKDNLLVDVDTTALVEIRDATTRAVCSPISSRVSPCEWCSELQRPTWCTSAMTNTMVFWRLPFYDSDGDTIPRWWEQLYSMGSFGMSDSNAADALTDSTAMVSTTCGVPESFESAVTDTDADGLTDSQEIVTHHTNPARTDTDGDGSERPRRGGHASHRSAGHGSDNDNFSDLDEVLYGGNPNDRPVCRSRSTTTARPSRTARTFRRGSRRR